MGQLGSDRRCPIYRSSMPVYNLIIEFSHTGISVNRRRGHWDQCPRTLLYAYWTVGTLLYTGHLGHSSIWDSWNTPLYGTGGTILYIGQHCTLWDTPKWDSWARIEGVPFIRVPQQCTSIWNFPICLSKSQMMDSGTNVPRTTS